MFNGYTLVPRIKFWEFALLLCNHSDCRTVINLNRRFFTLIKAGIRNENVEENVIPAAEPEYQKWFILFKSEKWTSKYFWNYVKFISVKLKHEETIKVGYYEGTLKY